MIGCFNCPITVNCPITLSDYSQLSDNTVRLQLYRMISEKKVANARISYEEIVMVMITNGHEGLSVTFEKSLPQSQLVVSRLSL